MIAKESLGHPLATKAAQDSDPKLKEGKIK